MDIFSYIDILVNSAGITRRAPAEKLTENEWNEVVDVCLKGTFFVSTGSTSS